MAAFIKESARVRTRRMWIVPVGLAVYLLVPVVLLVGAIAIHPHVPALVRVPVFLAFYVVVLSGIIGILSAQAYAFNRWLREHHGRVRADESGLWLDDALLVARTTIRHGRVLSDREGWYVQLGRRLRPVDVRVADEEEGRALLAGIRLESTTSVGRYAMVYGSASSAWWRAGMLIAVLIASCTVALALLGGPEIGFLVWFAYATVRNLREFVRVAVGVDGVRVHRLLGRARFVPFSALASADTDGRQVTLRLHDGSTIELHQAQGKVLRALPNLHAHSADDARLLVDRIHELTAGRRVTARGEHALARAGRPTREWMRELALASDEHASFRSAALAPEEMWRIVEDAGAPSTVRAGGALALRSRLDDEGRTRLRILADACASPRLRAAFTAAAALDDDDAVEHAYRELEDV